MRTTEHDLLPNGRCGKKHNSDVHVAMDPPRMATLWSNNIRARPPVAKSMSLLGVITRFGNAQQLARPRPRAPRRPTRSRRLARRRRTTNLPFV